MDIHPPSGPVHTVKDFFIHLLMIVIGILIAVALDQAVEWRRHQHLVREAESNLLSELRDNKAELDEVVRSYAGTGAQLNKAIDVMNQVKAHKKLTEISLSLNVHLAQLSSASRSSAEATGALGYMEYSEVKRLVAPYELQQQFNRVQDRLLDSVTQALGTLPQTGPEKASPAQLDFMTSQAETALGNLKVASDLAKALSSAYGKAMKPER